MLSRVLIFFGCALATPVVTSEKDLSSNLFSAIDIENKNLRGLNQPILQIEEYPELGWHEKYANRVLTDYLEKQGFNVTRGAYNLSTAFIAEYSNDKGRSVSFNAEYDALPDMGHACGHNLIATASVAAGLGVKNALKSGGLKGNVTILGTPGGGKAKLIQTGAYDNLDCSLMAHPGPKVYMFYAEYPALMAARVDWTGG
ncbi:hypothetical protein FOQG_15259 [Fusarium oxysporum f. sp. raphani 54005]|uniref:Peptidase M20 dimerisation domain-containing protein n=1 Tax=Fusarium oxysporum f. sp. raphani 54005 TaxID=1089458 RepID=X0BMT3_FUSOX|nr:hypothetical protein FOQG_15259 [Fusarium oxysporum f. sp. raphani 54005]